MMMRIIITLNAYGFAMVDGRIEFHTVMRLLFLHQYDITKIMG